MTTLLVSDLHLDDSRPHITRLFVEFLRTEAAAAAALYILGDLFEAWIGDDAPDATAGTIAAALADLHAAGIPAFYLHGNRDFLLGDAWARCARLTLLPDPALVDIEGVPTLLMHGDTLCTDDAAYQAFRAQSHAPGWQRDFLARDVAERRAFAGAARAESRRHTGSVAPAIMDVNPAAVVEALGHHAVTRLIHGHTHRPAVHCIDVDGQPAERIVLGDWYEQGSVLRIDGGSVRLDALPAAPTRS
jgi:UDP-2,3-diacylglucosamine hydrolase